LYHSQISGSDMAVKSFKSRNTSSVETGEV